jgi:hypothetical protein
VLFVSFVVHFSFFMEKLLGSLVNPLTLALVFAVWAFLHIRGFAPTSQLSDAINNLT